VTSSKPGGTYGGGEIIDLNVTFNKHVTVNCFRDALRVCQATPFVQVRVRACMLLYMLHARPSEQAN
jgi:hypothetical protein